MVYRIIDKDFDALTFDLDYEIESYRLAREDHKHTEGVPAPTAPHPMIEEIVRRHNSEYVIVPTKVYIRVMDGVIIDKKAMAVPPVSADWVEATSPDQLMGHYWDADSNAWIKPGTKEAKLETLENENTRLKRKVEGLESRLQEYASLEARLAALENKG